MAQTIDEQINTIERALGERMILHALVILRAWLNELGESNPYEEAFALLQSRYNDLFVDWLSTEDPSREETLNHLTGDTYRLVDAAYAAIRVHRGLSPEMHGFNGENAQSVMHYFGGCVQLQERDFQWLNTVLNDDARASIALMAVASLAKNLCECFSEQAIMALIDGIGCTNTVVAEQCLANVLVLLAHYDVRIDFFPNLQNAFIEAIGDGETAFETLGAMIRSTKMNLRDMIAKQEINYEDLPDELRDLLSQTGSDNDINGIVSWMPASEKEYMSGLVQILPDTWVFNLLLEDNPERQRLIALYYLSVGKMDLSWDNPETAEHWLRARLRKGEAEALDYINYGHCLLLRGDRMMAFENYRRARQMCKSAKEFYALFRPDRRQLVEHGIPIEQVYLIEDQLINS